MIDALPWAAMLVRGGLAVLGTAMVASHEPTVNLPRITRARDGRRTSSMLTFGIGYAVASLSCTLPVFLVVVAGAIPRTNVIGGVLLFLVYGLGTSLVLVALTLALAVGKDGVVRTLRRWSGQVQRVSSVILLIAGGYIVWFWATSLADPLATSGAVLTVERWSSTLTGLIGAHPWWTGSALLLLVLAALAYLLGHRSRRDAAEREVVEHRPRPHGGSVRGRVPD